jgi:hypothetical protein
MTAKMSNTWDVKREKRIIHSFHNKDIHGDLKLLLGDIERDAMEVFWPKEPVDLLVP